MSGPEAGPPGPPRGRAGHPGGASGREGAEPPGPEIHIPLSVMQQGDITTGMDVVL